MNGCLRLQPPGNPRNVPLHRPSTIDHAREREGSENERERDSECMDRCVCVCVCVNAPAGECERRKRVKGRERENGAFSFLRSALICLPSRLFVLVFFVILIPCQCSDFNINLAPSPKRGRYLTIGSVAPPLSWMTRNTHGVYVCRAREYAYIPLLGLVAPSFSIRYFLPRPPTARGAAAGVGKRNEWKERGEGEEMPRHLRIHR